MTSEHTPQGRDWAAPDGTAGVPSAPTGAPYAAAESKPAPAPQSRPVEGPALSFRSWQPGILPLRPMPFGDLLVGPFKAMRFNRSVIVGGPLLLILATGLASALATWVALNDELLDLRGYYFQPEGIEPATVAAILLSVLVFYASDLVANAIVIPAVARSLIGERLSLKAAFDGVRLRAKPLVLLYLIFGAAYTVLLIGTFGIPFALFATSNPVAVVIGVIVLIVFSLVTMAATLVVPIYQAVSRGIVMMEGGTAKDAIKRSLTLVRGRFWWSILTIFTTASIIGVVGQLLSSGFSIVAIVIPALAPGSTIALAIGFGLAFVLQLLASYILQYSYLGSLYGLMYIDMRIRKEGLAFEMARAAEARQRASQYTIG